MREHMLRVATLFNTGKLIVKHGITYSFSPLICDVNVRVTQCIWCEMVNILGGCNPCDNIS